MEIKPSEITPKHQYLSRRDFIKSAGLLAGTTALLAACAVPPAQESGSTEIAPSLTEPVGPPTATPIQASQEGLTSFEAVTNFNNFYEFTIDKENVAKLAKDFVSSPWEVEVGGLVNNPQVFDVGDLVKNFSQEERIYRMRCVEGWSMVIPWLGFPLRKLLDVVEPMSTAKYVRFETLYDPDRLPGQKSRWYEWPYIEGLRIDEAMNDLVILSTGLYGEALLPQNGAPIRLVVPWKYGFKSIKSIVRIDLVEEMPTSLWMDASPNEYGFYANVNPEVNHPRWSQSSERRIGELGRRQTLMFNGYGEQVSYLYEGMDLRANY